MKSTLRTVAQFIALAALLVGITYTGATICSNARIAGTNPLIAALQGNEQFDGKRLYDAALDAVASRHKDLADPAAQKKFRQDWDSSRFDKTGELKTEEGTDKAIQEMMHALGQRYDYFFDKDATKAEQEQVNSQLVGVGMTIKLRDQESIIKALPLSATRKDADAALKIGKGHEMLVDNVLEGAPAEKFLQAGDEIVKVDGQVVDGKLLKDVIALIRGQEGTDVEITVKRTAAAGTVSEQTFKITRKLVELHVVHTKDLGDGITYVKLDNFMSKNATKEFAAALQKAAKGKGLIIDLRGNPGGSLDTVMTMGAYLLPDGTLLELHQRDGDQLATHVVAVRKDYVLHEDPDPTNAKQISITVSKRPPLIIPEDMPIVVLVDEHSASASEILSGLLQHARRAIIVGKPTVGKGVGQSVVDLPFGRRLHVTSFEFLPGGKAMDWIGIIPDVDVTQSKPASAKAKTDDQLDSAKGQVKQGITNAEARAKKADELNKKNHEEFDKKLKARKQKKS